MQRSNVTWDEVIKKEAKGLDNFSFGEVHYVGLDYVHTEKGMVAKHRYYLPKALVRGFDGKTLWFNIGETQANAEFMRETPPSAGEYDRYATTTQTVETVPYIQGTSL